MQPSKFKKALSDSLANLKAVTGWHTCEIVNAGRDAAKVCIVKKPPQAAMKRINTAPSSAPAASGKITTVTWDNIRSDFDLVDLSADELITLMDEQAKSEWAAALATHRTTDEGIAWEAARRILERQWVALLAERDPGSDPYDI